MILCYHHLMDKKRKKMITAFCKKGLDKKILRSVFDAICTVLKTYFNNKTNYILLTYYLSINAAI